MATHSIKWPTTIEQQKKQAPETSIPDSLMTTDKTKSPHTWHQRPRGCVMFDPDNEHYSSLAIPISELEDLFNHKLAGTFPPNIWSLEGRIAYVLFGAHEHHELDHPERPLGFCQQYLPGLKRAREELVKRGQGERDDGDQLWQLSDIIRRLEDPAAKL